MSTHVTVKRLGKRLAVVIPDRFAKTRGIAAGTVLNIEHTRVVKTTRRRYTLTELMRGFKPSHRHGEWDAGNTEFGHRSPRVV